MSRVKLLSIVFLLISPAVFAQKPAVNEYAVIDKKALQLPDSLTQTTDEIASFINQHFRSNKDKSRAIFIWIASNIEYDLANKFAINFYETQENLINKPLKSRKGVCANYAALFTDLCTKSGIKSFVVEGYTKQNGANDFLTHAWCSAYIDTSWLLFDPTWGSGYSSNGKFVKKINNNYFAVKPGTLIKSHMPFDPLWQFLNYPVTSQEFYEGKTLPDKSKPFFNYPDSIKAYEQQPRMAQLEAIAARIEKNGVKNSMIFDRLRHIKMEIETDRENRRVNLHNENIKRYNEAVVHYNEGVNRLNTFIQYLNKEFIPIKPDAEIQEMIDSADGPLKEATTLLNGIVDEDATTTTLTNQLQKSIKDAAVRVQEQQTWLKTYFSKGKSGRKSMFRKYTWFGIPLN